MTNLRLTIIAPGDAPWALRLGAVVSIGRASDNTIRVDDSSVSRYHAVIEERDGAHWLRDLGSSNGTTVNQSTVGFEVSLTVGDTIGIAGVATIVIGEAQSNAEPERQPAAG